MLTCQHGRESHRPTRRPPGPPPRSDGERSRAAILREAARLATVDGLDGLSLARLADAVGMSKSGLFAHFGSKEELQLATVDAASAIFEELVIEPARRGAGRRAPAAGLRRAVPRPRRGGRLPRRVLLRLRGGELDARPGPVRDGAMAFSQRWLALLAEEVAAGQAAGELDPAADPPQIAFELNAFMVLGNMQFVASGDPAALDRVRRAVENRLVALVPAVGSRRRGPNRSDHKDV